MIVSHQLFAEPFLLIKHLFPLQLRKIIIYFVPVSYLLVSVYTNLHIQKGSNSGDLLIFLFIYYRANTKIANISASRIPC